MVIGKSTRWNVTERASNILPCQYLLANEIEITKPRLGFKGSYGSIHGTCHCPLCQMFIFTRMQFAYDKSKFHVSFWRSLSWKIPTFLVTSPTQTWKITWDAVHSPSPWCLVENRTCAPLRGHLSIDSCCILRKSDYFSSIWSWTFSLYKTIFRTNLSGGFLTCLANLLKSPRNESGRRDGAWSLPTLCAFLCPNNHCDLLFVFLAHVNHSAGYQHLPESF